MYIYGFVTLYKWQCKLQSATYLKPKTANLFSLLQLMRKICTRLTMNVIVAILISLFIVTETLQKRLYSCQRKGPWFYNITKYNVLMVNIQKTTTTIVVEKFYFFFQLIIHWSKQFFNADANLTKFYVLKPKTVRVRNSIYTDRTMFFKYYF